MKPLKCEWTNAFGRAGAPTYWRDDGVIIAFTSTDRFPDAVILTNDGYLTAVPISQVKGVHG